MTLRTTAARQDSGLPVAEAGVYGFLLNIRVCFGREGHMSPRGSKLVTAEVDSAKPSKPLQATAWLGCVIVSRQRITER